MGKLQNYLMIHLRSRKYNIRQLRLIFDQVAEAGQSNEEVHQEIEYLLRNQLKEITERDVRKIFEPFEEKLLFEQVSREESNLLTEVSRISYHFLNADHKSDTIVRFLSGFIEISLGFSDSFSDLQKARQQEIQITQKELAKAQQLLEERQRELRGLKPKDQNEQKQHEEELEYLKK